MRRIILAAAVAGAALAMAPTFVPANDRADRRDDRTVKRRCGGSTIADSDGDDGA